MENGEGTPAVAVYKAMAACFRLSLHLLPPSIIYTILIQIPLYSYCMSVALCITINT